MAFLIAFLLTLLAIILNVVGVSPQWLRQRGSHSWPWAKTTIESGFIERILQRRHYSYVLMVTYSYSVNSEEYLGTYEEVFGSEPQAQRALKSLRELPPPARYKSSDPSQSVMDPYRDAGLAVTSDRPENTSS
jgi:hypothetical protein